MSVTEPIQIPIEGDARDFIADAKKVQQQMDILEHRLQKAGVSQAAYNTAVNNSKTAMSGQVEGVKKSAMSITDLRSAYMIAADAARVAGQVWQATGQEFVNYAEQVKNMSRSLGASAEETSRIIQVADDVRISYESLGVAMKTAQKNGIQPNIEGLAKLADQYKAIQSPTERTKFLLDTFGKSGLEMGKLLEKGSEGIRSMSAAIDENMIVTAEGIKASDEYQLALDNMNDSYTAIKITIGSYLVGPATDLLNHYRDITTSLKENGYWYTLTHQFTLDEISAKREEADATFIAADANNDFSGALSDGTDALDGNKEALDAQKEAVKQADDALKDYKDQLDAVSQANQDAESFIQNYAEGQKEYADQHWEALGKIGDAEAALDEARRKKYTGKDAGQDRQEAINEATAGIDEAKKAVADLEVKWHESTQMMIYDMILAKVSVDGLTDAEFKATQDKAVQMGIRTEAEAEQAKAMMDTATAAADGIALQEDVMREKAATDAELLALENARALAADTTTQTVVGGAAAQAQAIASVTTTTMIETNAQYQLASAARATAAAYKSISSSGGGSPVPLSSYKVKTGGKSPDERGHASGGDFLIPMSYGNEGFAMGNGDTASGGERVTITPKGQAAGGVVYNVTVNNPKKETAENSIRSTLKSLSYRGS